jgi:hypothetical protein
MSPGFHLSHLQAAFRKFYGRYNDLVCQYNLPLGQILSDVFHTYLSICWRSVLPYTRFCNCLLDYDYVLHINFAILYFVYQADLDTLILTTVRTVNLIWWSGNRIHGRCDRLTGDVYSSYHVILPLVHCISRGPCLPHSLICIYPTGLVGLLTVLY